MVIAPFSAGSAVPPPAFFAARWFASRGLEALDQDLPGIDAVREKRALGQFHEGRRGPQR